MDKKTSCRAKAGQDAFCMDGIDLLFHYDPLSTDYDALIIGCHFLAEEIVEGSGTKGRRVGMNRLDACDGIGGSAEAAHLVGYAYRVSAGCVTFRKSVGETRGEGYGMTVFANDETDGGFWTSPGKRAVGEHYFDVELLGVVLRIPIGEYLVERIFGSLLFGDDTWVGVGSGIACADGA